MRPADLDDLLHIFGDPAVMASFGGTTFDRVRMARWLQRNLEHQARYGYGLFAVILEEEGVLVGDCGLEYKIIGESREAELGYDIRSSYWNRGLATEAATAVRDFAFDTLALPRLVSLIRVHNWASRRVAEKIGMRLEETLYRDAVQYWLYAMKSADR